MQDPSEVDYQPFSNFGQQETTWDENAEKYRCCCSKYHVMTGAWLVGLISFFFVVLGLIATSFWWSGYINFPDSFRNRTTRQHPWHFRNRNRSAGRFRRGGFLGRLSNSVETKALETLWQCVQIVTLILLFVGLCKEKARLVLPQVIVEAVNIVLVGLAVGFMLVGSIFEFARNLTGATFVVAFMVLLTFMGSIGLTVWFFCVIKRCHTYLLDAADSRIASASYELPLDRGTLNAPSQ